MDAPDLSTLNQMQRQFAAAGKNYVKLDSAGGNAQVSTSGVFSRWNARSLHRDADANRQNIDSLLNRLGNTPGLSREFVQTLRGRVASQYESGKPLSGRVAAELVESTINEASTRYAAQKTVEINVRDAIDNLTVDNLIGKLGGDVAYSLGVSPDELKQWETEIAGTAASDLKAAAAKEGRSPSAESVGQAVRKAVTLATVNHHGPAILKDAKAQENYPDANLDKMMENLRLQFPQTVEKELNVSASENLRPDLLASLEKSCAEQVHIDYVGTFRSMMLKAVDCSTPDSPLNTLVADKQARVGINTPPEEHAVKELSTKMAQEFIRSLPDEGTLPPMPSPTQLLDTIGAIVEKRLAQPENYGAGTTQLTGDEINTMKNLLRTDISTLNPKFYPALETFQLISKTFVADLDTAQNENDVTAALSRYFTEYNKVIHPTITEDGNKPSAPVPGADEYHVMSSLGLRAALERPDAGEILGKLASPGSPFLSVMHKRREVGPEGAAADNLLTLTMADKLSSLGGTRLAQSFLDPGAVENLPLRERAVAKDHPELTPPPEFINRDRTVWLHNITQSLNGNLAPGAGEIPNDSAPDSPQWKVSDKFLKDAARVNLVMNGQRMLDGEALFNTAPTRREAAQISRVFYQVLGAEGFEAESAEGKKYLSQGWTSGMLMADPQTDQIYNVDSLGDGTYRVSFQMHKYTKDENGTNYIPGSVPVTHLLHQLSFNLHTGDTPPGRRIP